jgi:hypothetical protein
LSFGSENDLAGSPGFVAEEGVHPSRSSCAGFRAAAHLAPHSRRFFALRW